MQTRGNRRWSPCSAWQAKPASPTGVAGEVIERVVDALADWRTVGSDLGVRQSTQAQIARQLTHVRHRNRHLTAGQRRRDVSME